MNPHIALKVARGSPAVAAAIATIVASVSSAAAQSFDELAFRLLEHPEIVSIRLESEAQQELSDAAGALPDPVIRIGVNNVPVSDPTFNRFLPSNKAIEFQQRIPNGRLRSALASSAQATAHVNSLQAAYRLAQLRAALIAALADKSRVREQIELTLQRELKFAQLTEVLGSEIEAGRAVAFRVAEIDVARAQVARQLAELKGELARLDAALISLVGIAADATPPLFDAATWRGDPHEFHEVRLAAAGIDIAEAGIDQAQAGYRPEWGVNLTYKQREAGGDGADFSGDDWFSAHVSFTIPLWGRKSQAPRVRAASARHAAARHSLEATVRNSQAMWSSLNATANAAQQSSVMLERTLAAIDAQGQALTINYEAGIGDYPPVLEAEIAGLQLRSQLAAERSRQLTLLAQARSMLVSP